MSFFTAKGRLRRRHYYIRTMLLFVAGILFYALPSLLAPSSQSSVAEIAATLGMAAVYYLLVMQSLKRLHDLNISAWWLLLGLVPLASYILGSGLQFVQGTIGPNRFGPDPKRPHLAPDFSSHI